MNYGLSLHSAGSHAIRVDSVVRALDIFWRLFGDPWQPPISTDTLRLHAVLCWENMAAPTSMPSAWQLSSHSMLAEPEHDPRNVTSPSHQLLGQTTQHKQIGVVELPAAAAAASCTSCLLSSIRKRLQYRFHSLWSHIEFAAQPV